MPDELIRLPLFPLNVVMFPNTSIPLQIFEDRYKQMLRDCLDGDSRFGVTLIKEGAEVGDPATPHPVGHSRGHRAREPGVGRPLLHIHLRARAV